MKNTIAELPPLPVQTDILKTTTVEEPAFVPKRIHDPATIFADYGWAARKWCYIAILFAVIAIASPYAVIQAMKTKQKVAIIGGDGSFTITPLLETEEATELHAEVALMATTALFSRNPAGFDNPEQLQKLFSPNSYNDVINTSKTEETEYKEKQIHQKPEVLKINILATRNEQVLVEVIGQLIRQGTFQNQPFNEGLDFVARYTLIPNPNLIFNKRFPLVAVAYATKILPKTK